jgi:hypothetical protein
MKELKDAREKHGGDAAWQWSLAAGRAAKHGFTHNDATVFNHFALSTLEKDGADAQAIAKKHAARNLHYKFIHDKDLEAFFRTNFNKFKIITGNKRYI